MVGTVGNGTMLKLYPDTRFSYADLMLQQYLRNKLYLEQLILHPEFENICLKISSRKVDEFKDIILPSITSDNHRFDRKVALLHDLTKLVCKLIHHVEQKLCKASWINALFFALMKDFDAWSNNNHVQATFDVDFITAVHKALTDRWRGEREGNNGRVRNIRPFKSKVWTAAAMFDPYYTPTEEEYSAAVDDDVLDYVASIQNMMEPYLGTNNQVDERIEVFGELNEMVLRRGRWGELISSFQRSLPEPPRTCNSHVEKEIFRQNSMRPVASFWETLGRTTFPKCCELALRLSVLSVQSADVERMCKAHNVIHTKTRNRLKHARVKKLLYCYINLRLIEKSDAEPEFFLLSVDDDDNEEDEYNNEDEQGNNVMANVVTLNENNVEPVDNNIEDIV